MRRLHKSKRVSWAADVNLSQVQLFLSEERPSQVGFGGQDHLQAKLHLTGTGSDDIPLIAWSRPYMIVVDATWVVAAGDESKEVEILNQREMRVLEAVYPHPSAIPPKFDISHALCLISLRFALTRTFLIPSSATPLIPVTPIEDEDADTPLDSMEGFSSDEQGNLIDHDLLVKILSNQNMIEKLVRDYEPSANQSNVVGVGHLPDPLLPPPGVVLVSSQPSAKAPPRDMNYYKSLIQQHGGERQEQFGNDRAGGANQESLNNPKPRIMKPCLFFNSAKGCRNGLNCTYQHDETSPKSKAKRRRMEGKDKSLIQQHGGERQEQVGNDRAGEANQESLNNPNPRIMKPCLFFNIARGCSNGLNCTYRHDETSPKSKAKRRRMEGKDKSLIQQHGGERQEQVGNNWAGGANQESLNNPNPRIMKPCLFFNSDRGCSYGSNCRYQHDETQKIRQRHDDETQKVTQRHDEMSPKSKAKRRRRQRNISIPHLSIRPISSDSDVSANHAWDLCKSLGFTHSGSSEYEVIQTLKKIQEENAASFHDAS